jgi:hypothetical protein
MDHNQQGGQPRRHFHRGRRGSDRRGQERRQPNAPQHEQPHRGGEHVDVEQIMRDIRARISQGSGVDLSNQQIQELAARRLEAVLDPRTLKPALLDQLRKSAGVPAGSEPRPSEAAYTFDADTLFASQNGFMRFLRSLFRPLLKLFFNPDPLVQALATQVRINADTAAREAARDRQQAEWNALHYELLQRVVTESSRISIEMQALSLRIESLSAKVDFNERRVRGIESSHRPQPQRQPRHVEPPSQQAPATPAVTMPAAPAAEGDVVPANAVSGEAAATSDAPRRRRRRRRGRRGGTAFGEAATAPGTAGQPLEADAGDLDEGADGDDDGLDGPGEELGATEAAAPPTVDEPAVVAAPPVAAVAEEPPPAVQEAPASTESGSAPESPTPAASDEPAQG